MRLGETTQAFASPTEALAHISEAAWSDYKKSDYTLEQWHAACIIHIHDGAPTSKGECKLPVKTPDGALNRNGVHAAAAALAGARGGLKGVSAEQKKQAGNALKRYYAQLDEEAPESLSQGEKPSLEDLVHYGVKGMRWGVRNEEDTDGRSSSAKPQLSERNQQRVEKFKQRSDVLGTKVSELKLKNEKLQGTQNPAQLYTQSVNRQTIRDLEKAQQRALRDAEAVQKGKLTSTQKKMIIGGVAVSALLVAGVGASYYVKGTQSGQFNSLALRGKAFLRGEKIPFKVDQSLSKAMSAEELLAKIAKPVNPNYSKMGGKMNCRRSTFAYELRRRGFDVHATTSSVGWGQSESGVINAVTPGSKNFFSPTSMSSTVVNTGFSSVAEGDTRTNPLKKLILDNLQGRLPSIQEQAEAIRNNGGRMPASMQTLIDQAGKSSSARVLEELAKQPNGARGEVMFKFSGFGHSMAYEIVDGVPHIFDSQKGTLYNSATKMVESKWDGFHGAEITRLDNVNLDLNFLTRWATNN